MRRDPYDNRWPLVAEIAIGAFLAWAFSIMVMAAPTYAEARPAIAYDLNGDKEVDGVDLGIMLGRWGEYDQWDLGALLGQWGACVAGHFGTLWAIPCERVVSESPFEGYIRYSWGLVYLGATAQRPGRWVYTMHVDEKATQ